MKNCYYVKAGDALPKNYIEARGWTTETKVDFDDIVSTFGVKDDAKLDLGNYGYTNFPVGANGSLVANFAEWNMATSGVQYRILDPNFGRTGMSWILKGTNPVFNSSNTKTKTGSQTFTITRTASEIKFGGTSITSFSEGCCPLKAIIEIQGAGGGGGGCEAASGGAGGGSGAYGIFLIDLTGTTTITLGAGGSGATGSSNTNGSAGGSSTISSSLGGSFTLGGGGGGHYGHVDGAGGSAGSFSGTSGGGITKLHGEAGAVGGASGTGTGGGTGGSWVSRTCTLNAPSLATSYKSYTFGNKSPGSSLGAAGAGAASAIANGGSGGTSTSVDGTSGSNGSGGGGGSFKGVWPAYTAGDGGNGGAAWCRIWY